MVTSFTTQPFPMTVRKPRQSGAAPAACRQEAQATQGGVPDQTFATTTARVFR